MVDRFTSDPLELPPAEQPFRRADLLFYGVVRAVDSYEARVFLAAPRISRIAEADHPAYAGSFYVFGHRECAGDVGHCEIPPERDAFDLRLPHHLEPGIQIVTITDALIRVLAMGTTAASVSVVAHVFGSSKPEDVLGFDRVRLATYS